MLGILLIENVSVKSDCIIGLCLVNKILFRKQILKDQA